MVSLGSVLSLSPDDDVTASSHVQRSVGQWVDTFVFSRTSRLLPASAAYQGLGTHAASYE